MILDTSAKNFTTWLRNRPLHEQRVDHPDGELTLWVKPARVRTTTRGSQLVERLGEYWIHSPGGVQVEKLGAVIWFDVLALGDERIEVISDCEETGAMLIYLNTLANIAQTWPKAQAEVLAYLFEIGEGKFTGIEWWDRRINEKAQSLRAELLDLEGAKEVRQDKPQWFDFVSGRDAFFDALLGEGETEAHDKPADAEAGELTEPQREKTPRWDVQVRGTKAYNRIHKENQGKTAACNLEGIDPRTYDDYLERSWIPLKDEDME